MKRQVEDKRKQENEKIEQKVKDISEEKGDPDKKPVEKPKAEVNET